MWITIHKLGPDDVRIAESQKVAEEIRRQLNRNKKTFLISDQRLLNVQKVDLLHYSRELMGECIMHLCLDL